MATKSTWEQYCNRTDPIHHELAATTARIRFQYEHQIAAVQAQHKALILAIRSEYPDLFADINSRS